MSKSKKWTPFGIVTHIRSHSKVLIKWFVGLSLPPALNCISIDFKASMHQRRTSLLSSPLYSSLLLSCPLLSSILKHQYILHISCIYMCLHDYII